MIVDVIVDFLLGAEDHLTLIQQGLQRINLSQTCDLEIIWID